MTENAPDDCWEVDRTSPVVDVDLGDKQLRLTYFNTVIYAYVGGWAMANHVYVSKRPEPGGTYLFDCDDLMDSLAEQNYPYHSLPFPTDSDVLAFRAFQTRRLEVELRSLGETGSESPGEADS